MDLFDFNKFFNPYRETVGDASDGASRCEFYSYVIPKLVKRNKNLRVIETGTMSSKDQGAFTLIMADLIKNWTGGKIYSIDISREYLEESKKLTSNFSDVIEYVNSDSVDFLSKLNNENLDIDLLYLDSHDLNLKDPHPSAAHHLRELGAIYDSLDKDTVIAVDDNFGPDVTVEWFTLDNLDKGRIIDTCDINTGENVIGKAAYIDLFLLANKWERNTEFDAVAAGKGQFKNVYCYEKK